MIFMKISVLMEKRLEYFSHNFPSENLGIEYIFLLIIINCHPHSFDQVEKLFSHFHKSMIFISLDSAMTENINNVYIL